MNPAQVAKMKNKIAEDLRQLDTLRQSMTDTLALLTEWEKQLRKISHPKKDAARRAAITEQPATPLEERINKALSHMRSEFTRADLLQQIESDGKKLSGVSVFRREFSALIRSGRIKCVEGRENDADSLYVLGQGKKNS